MGPMLHFEFFSPIIFLHVIAVLSCLSGGLVISGFPANDFQPADNPSPARTHSHSRRSAVDTLTKTEEINLLAAHNHLRRAENLVWDHELVEWANWVISCNADYPGPHYSYTNFSRFNSSTTVNDVVNAWGREGRDTTIKLEKGCRTPYDRTPCNHYTNMMQPQLKFMACAASRCGNMRQLVCIYSSSTTVHQ